MHTYLIVLGVAGLLGFSSLILPLARRLQIPYTVFLAIIGGALGAIEILTAEYPGHGIWYDFLFALKNIRITSDTVLFLFLPALVFESAFSINTHRLIEDLFPVLILAIAGLFISTLVIGISVGAVSEVGLLACLLLGAILSATDPVAVVAIFTELQAPKRLAILVEGESLFNDATAIVLYSLLSAMILGQSDLSWFAGLTTFFRVFLGGALIGLVCGWLVCLIFNRLGKYPTVEITLTISLAYLSFVIAEHYFHVSGVMAVVLAALMVGTQGRSVISPGTWNTMKEIWEYIGFWANSLIFILVGLAVPGIIVAMNWQEVQILGVLLVSAFVARAGIIYGLLPAFNRLKWMGDISLAYKTVMFWGGLRGAVSLALALAVMENPAFPQEVRHFIGVLVTAFVLFTLFVNATTIGMVIRFLGLDRLSTEDQAIRVKAMEITLDKLGHTMETAGDDFQVPAELSHSVIARYENQKKALKREWEKLTRVSPPDWIRIGLIDLTHHERSGYLKLFEEGWVDSALTRMLLNRSEDLLDEIRNQGMAGYEKSWRRRLQFDWKFYLGRQLLDRFNVSGPLSKVLSDRFEMLIFQRRTLRGLFPQSFERLMQLVGREAQEELKRAVELRLGEIQKALDLLRLQYPEYARALEKRHLRQMGLRLEDAEFRSLLSESLISKEVFGDLEKELESQAEQLSKRPELDLGLDPTRLVQRVPFFAECTPEQIGGIIRLLHPRLAIPGEHIVRKGETGDAMYFISSGSVEVVLEQNQVLLGTGDFFGEIALVKEIPRVADIVARGFCNLLVLNRKDFQVFMQEHPDFREILEKTVTARMKADGIF